MMKCEFSETQFVFGIMNELINKCWQTKKGWKFPYFPTHRQEKQLGYDVKITGPVRNVFFQFKVPDKKTTRNAKYWNEFSNPYYEFKIWPDNVTHQHNELVSLANSDQHNKVYYCSPGFHTFIEFEGNYRRGEIARNSIFVPCKNLPTISGNDKHSISYILESERICNMHSEKFSMDAFDVEKLAKDIGNAEAYENVYECLVHIAGKFSIAISDRDNTEKMYAEIANYLVINKNLYMLLVYDCQ